MFEIVSKLRDLAPWHFHVDLGGGVSTLDGNTAKYGEKAKWPIGIVNPNELAPLLDHLYPNGLAGKRFLDVACNGGGYSLLAKQLGADYVLGFDARQHWIDQASFVVKHLGITGVDFRVDGAHTFSSAEPFDITLFKGIFYHLADPVATLRRFAEVTREIIIVDTATDGERGELLMRFKSEDRAENLMTGVERIAWMPSGPDLIEALLKRIGFPATREISWKQKSTKSGVGSGRCRVLGARSEDLLVAFDQTFGPVKQSNPPIKRAAVRSL